jgi:photosystem II stability/assembly factor-like uncharacterized protein
MKIFTVTFYGLIINAVLALSANAQPGWTTLESSPSNSYRHEDLWFINPNTGWLGAGSQGIWRTTDGGATWQQQSTLTYIRCIGFADSLYGWAGNLNAGTTGIPIYRTTNGGTTWENVTLPSPGTSGSCGIWVYSRDVVNIAGKYSGPARFIRTTNSGASWTVKDMSPYASSLVDCYFYSRDSGFVVGYNNISGSHKGVVLFTSDGGETWATRYTTSQSIDYGWKLSFPSRNTGYASTQTFSASSPQVFLKTTNGGVNWSELNYTSGIGVRSVQGLGFATNELGWIGSFSNGPTYVTTNGGTSWSPVSFGTAINRFRFLNDSIGYASGNKVYKYVRPSATGTGNILSTIPSEFRLYQNYPNPFNPSTVIYYDVPRAQNVRMDIYSINGKLIKTLQNKYHTAGRYSINFEPAGFSSGIYLYRLFSGSFVQTRKMIFIK